MNLITSKDKQSGFTLIELILCVGIVGLLSAIAIPQFNEYKKNAYDSKSLVELRNAIMAIEVSSQDETCQVTTMNCGIGIDNCSIGKLNCGTIGYTSSSGTLEGFTKSQDTIVSVAVRTPFTVYASGPGWSGSASYAGSGYDGYACSTKGGSFWLLNQSGAFTGATPDASDLVNSNSMFIKYRWNNPSYTCGVSPEEEE